MSDMKINLDEPFQHLDKAPIVEAVVDIRARIGKEWEEQILTQELGSRLNDYPTKNSYREIRQHIKFEAGQTPELAQPRSDWKGIRFRTNDGLQIAQFNRDGFVYSRLAPYENWSQLVGEALRLWEIYLQVGGPVEIHRVGLRFINRIILPSGETQFEDFIVPHPRPPTMMDMPFAQFFEKDTFQVPGYPYGIHVIRAIQPPEDGVPDRINIILDTDVFTIQPTSLDKQELERRLEEMRWLKNKVFFGSVTSKALALFKD